MFFFFAIFYLFFVSSFISFDSEKLVILTFVSVFFFFLTFFLSFLQNLLDSSMLQIFKEFYNLLNVKYYNVYQVERLYFSYKIFFRNFIIDVYSFLHYSFFKNLFLYSKFVFNFYFFLSFFKVLSSFYQFALIRSRFFENSVFSFCYPLVSLKVPDLNLLFQRGCLFSTKFLFPYRVFTSQSVSDIF
jgi:hypothetical protein